MAAIAELDFSELEALRPEDQPLDFSGLEALRPKDQPLDFSELEKLKSSPAPVAIEATQAELVEADRPARMTLTRGGQPQFVGKAPVPTIAAPVEPAKPTPSWEEVVKSLPMQLVAGTVSAGKNLQEMIIRDELSALSEAEQRAKPTTLPQRIAQRERSKLKIKEYEKMLQSATPEAALAREILSEATPKNMTVMQQALSSLAQSAPSTLVGIAAGILTKNPVLAMTIAGGGGAAYQAGATYGEAIEKGAPHKVAALAAKIDGILEGGGEAIGLGYALKSGAPILKRIVSTIAVEAGQEAATQLSQDVNAFLSYNPEITLGEVWNNVQVAALAGTMGGAIYGGAGAAVESQTGASKEFRGLAKDIEATNVTEGTEQVAVEALSPERAQLRLVPKEAAPAVQQAPEPVEVAAPAAQVAPGEAQVEAAIPETPPAAAPATEAIGEPALRFEDVPADLTINEPTFVEETGETVQVKRNAREAFREADQRVNRYQALLDCLGRAA